MKHGKLLIVVALGASLALAVASPSQAANGRHNAPSRNHGNNGHGNGHGVGNAHAPRCSYPPVTTPALWLGAIPGSVRPNETLRLTGTLKVNGCGLGQWTIGLYSSNSPSGPFSLAAATTTNGNGEYSFYVKQPKTRSYQTASATSEDYNSAVSNIVTVPKK